MPSDPKYKRIVTIVLTDSIEPISLMREYSAETLEEVVKEDEKYLQENVMEVISAVEDADEYTVSVIIGENGE